MNANNALDREQARLLVRAVFEEMGIDVSTPDARIELQKDLAFIREWRQATNATRSFALKAVVTLVVSGLVGLVLIGFKWWSAH